MSEPGNQDPFSSELLDGSAEKEFLVVGLGASAGGITALRDFFANVPADSGMAYVVILHLSPDHDSQLATVLQQVASIPVTQVEGNVRVEPDHAYVIPPNRSMAMTAGFLILSDVTSTEARRAPVDIFFRTLAEVNGPRAVSVILSGTGANGSMGIKRVKEMGGLCIVQDPQETEYSEMVRHSLATGLVDYVLPVAQIPEQIVAYRAQLRRLNLPAGLSEPAEAEAEALRYIFTQLRVRTGHDFSNYKRPTIMRRIGRRMGVNQLETLTAYAQFMTEHPLEANALLKDLLISVTNFFRDSEAFERLERDIVPQLFDGKTAEDQVRAWVVGCATGEEAYTLTMMLADYAAKLAHQPQIQVFATDIDEDAIAVARGGYYTINDAADIPPERLSRYFVRDGDEGYRVRREIRERVLFAAHNVIKDPPFAHLSLITCRNLLIYLNRTAQRRVMEVLHFALNPGGYLMLGASESVEGATDLYATVAKEQRIYQGRPVKNRLVLPAPDGLLPALVGKIPEIRPTALRQSSFSTYAQLHQQLLERYAPPSIVVNEDFDMLHASETAGKFLIFKGGEPSLNLLHLVHPNLRLELRAALSEAVLRRRDIDSGPVPLLLGEERQLVRMRVCPVLNDEEQARGFLLVLFDEMAGAKATAELSAVSDGRADEEPLARQLEVELMEVKAQLSSTIEQHELQREELNASNEELQAMNEELRSASEELETSKEELQSINEELTTVNQELKVKIEELGHTNDDLQNLMNSTQIGTVFLDRELRVKLFTPRARDIFNLIPSDIGRPLTDITNKLDDEQFIADTRRVFERLQTVEREVRGKDGRAFLMSIAPYRTSDDRINGVIVALFDITERVRAEEAMRRSEQRSQRMVDSITDYAIITLDAEGLIETWNAGAERIFGFTGDEAVGQHTEIIFTPEDRLHGRPVQEMQEALERGRAADERWHVRKDGSRIFMSGVLTPHDESAPAGFVKIARDLTEHKNAEQNLRRAYEDLESLVRERTLELARANEALRDEISERIRTERSRVRLLREIVRAQEDERRRIAREIHDQLGQQTTALRLNLDSLMLSCGEDEEVRRKLEQTQAIAERLDADVDFLAWELRPAALDDLGLLEAIANYAREWSRHSGIPAEFHMTGMESERLAPEAESALYRITQEALNNIMKYARPTRVDVLLERRDQQVVLIIEDDGVGFDPQAAMADGKGLGLVGMRERATLVGGALEIESKPGEGTAVFARVPIKFLDEAEE
jgi:two-component system, chemotaxis family, CheB/CheR fusion protein